METYKKSGTKEKKIAKTVRKNHRRWKIGRWFVWLIAAALVCVVGGMAVAGLGELNGDAGVAVYISLLFIAAMFPVILLAIIYAVAIGGGRDIIYARLNEKVFLDQEGFKNTFTPQFRQIMNADMVMITVPYAWIRAMRWNAALCRLEIDADYRHTLYNGDQLKEELVQGKPVILYDYFLEMERLLDSLEQRTGKTIIGRHY